MSRSVAARVLARGLARPLGMAIAGAAFLLPFLWTLSTSLKPKAMILQVPPTFLPWPPTLENYANVFSSGFLRYLMNSSIVAVCTVIVVVTVSIHTGYAVSRFRFRGKAAMLFLILIGMAMGELSTVLPLYFFGSRVGLLDTYAGFILPTLAPAFGLYLFRQAMLNSVPSEIIESARIDGCGETRIFFQIVLPLVRPMLGAFLIISFIGTWNNFITPQVILQDPERHPLSVAIFHLRGLYGADYGMIMAATLISIAPVMALFLFLQREFIAGLTSGAVKG